MKILITGAAGFIGYHLSKKLLALGHDVTGVDNFSDYYDVSLKKERTSRLEHQNFCFLKKDINELNSMNTSFDLAINLAAQPGVRLPSSHHYLYKSTNEDGFENFMQFCLKNNIEKVIYASSSSVYSDGAIGRYKESSTKLLPKSKYGVSKLKNEQHAKKMFEKYNLSVIGLRFFSVYGPWGRPDMAYFLFTEAIKNNSQIFLHNNGQMARDMTYIDDVVEGIVRTINFQINSLKPINEIFNLGNDHPIETIKLLQTIEKKLGLRAKIKNTKTLNESWRTHANISKSRTLLGYSPKVSFNEGIEKFLNWHSQYVRR